MHPTLSATHPEANHPKPSLVCAWVVRGAPVVELESWSFDPPYAPLSDTAHFRSYTARGFGDADQQRLQELAIELARKGVHVLLSNSTAPCVLKLYEESADARKAGLRAVRIPARRAINSKSDRRGLIDELLVTNLPTHGVVARP